MFEFSHLDRIEGLQLLLKPVDEDLAAKTPLSIDFLARKFPSHRKTFNEPRSPSEVRGNLGQIEMIGCFHGHSFLGQIS